jgi:membrane dipeptidase
MPLDYTISEKARRLHADSIVFDGHCDTLLEILDGLRAWDKYEGKGQADLPRLREGGVTAQIFAAFVRPALRYQGPAETLRLIETLYAILDGWPADMLLATKAEDVRRAKREGKIAAVLSLEGSEGLDGDLTLLRAFYRLGVRNIGITHNDRNKAADGCAEARTGGGLSEFGVALVKEMARLGIMVDIAHLAPAGVEDVFEIYDGPVVASHANAKTICDHRRNLSDAQIERVAASGGVIGVTFVPAFIAENPAEATVDRLLDHVDHIVKVGGIDCVALGSDWDGFENPPEGFPQDVRGTPLFTERLLQRGYSEGDVRKFLGENWLRVFQRVAG